MIWTIKLKEKRHKWYKEEINKYYNEGKCENKNIKIKKGQKNLRAIILWIK